MLLTHIKFLCTILGNLPKQLIWEILHVGAFAPLVGQSPCHSASTSTDAIAVYSHKYLRKIPGLLKYSLSLSSFNYNKETLVNATTSWNFV